MHTISNIMSQCHYFDPKRLTIVKKNGNIYNEFIKNIKQILLSKSTERICSNLFST